MNGKNNISICFMSTQKLVSLSVAPNKETYEFILKLYKLFGLQVKNNKLKCPIFRYSEKQKQDFEFFFNHYISNCPQLWTVKTFLEECSINEYIFVCSDISKIPQKREIKIRKILARLNGVSIKMPFPMKCLDNYNYYSFYADNEIKVGERIRQKRRCRFCGKSMPEVSFKHKAHAFSEFLNNKKIILNEECDTCNEKFGNGIEQDFGNWILPSRIFFNVCGKTGTPTMSNSEVRMYRDDKDLDKKLKISIKRPVNHLQDLLTIPVCKGLSITPQNIYKTLCKYALSVINAELFCGNFTETINWITKDEFWGTLPVVKIRTKKYKLCEYPELIVFVKRAKSKQQLPKLWAFLTFGNLSMVYIVPSSKEENDFFAVRAHQDFFFDKVWSTVKKWESHDLSVCNKRKTEMTWRFKPNKNTSFR